MISLEDFETLESYAALEGSEIGEYVDRLLDVRNYSESHGMSEAFSDALDKELMRWLQRFEAETTIETRREPQPDREIKELVWIDA